MKKKAAAAWQTELRKKGTEGLCDPQTKTQAGGGTPGLCAEGRASVDEPGRGLGLTTQRQTQVAGVWGRLRLEVCAEQPGSPKESTTASAHGGRGTTQPGQSCHLH